MAIKPTPTKLVLLMSAAGLGLSWSGVAIASRDSHASASSALTFGVASRSEPGCDAHSPDGWASCPPSHGELVRTIVADTAALPLPLPAVVPASDGKVSFRAFDAYAAASAQRAAGAHTVDGEPEANDEAPPPETPIAARVTGDSNRDREADAIAMVLLDDPQAIAGDAATDSEPIAHAATATAVAGDSSIDVRRHVGTLDRSATTTTADAGKTAAPSTDDRSAGGAQAAISANAAPSDTASVEHVLASLAEVLGAQLDVPSSGIEAKNEQATSPKHEAALRASAAAAAPAPAPAQAVLAAPIDAALSGGTLLQRSSEVDEIVVAPSHSDKILMSLAALRSGGDSEVGRLGAQTKKTVVVSHTDKVLETLALFQSRKPKRAAWACTRTSDEEARVDTRPTEPRTAWEFAETTDEWAMAGLGREPDILLDLLPPVADRAEEQALQAAPSQAARPELPVAGRSERSAIGSELVALSADKLDEVRGGFVTDGGLKISFGIERAVYLNGNLVTTTSLSIADLSKISGGQAQVTSNGTAGSLALLQNGVGNVFAPGSISSTAAGTVIQNTLDNQKINTITRIDAVVNSAAIMRSMNLQSSMQSAIVNSLRR
jgi:hypothetical protein